MITLASLSVLFATILLSEVIGKHKIIYTRIKEFITIFIGVFLAFSIFVIVNNLLSLFQLTLVFITNIIFFMAWFGFWIHTSNSITLELLNIIIINRQIKRSSLKEKYNIEKKLKERKIVLIEGNYLTEKEELKECLKSKILVCLISNLRA
jgi:hypothetical protein